MTDPMALVTDSALGVAALIFAAKLWRVRRMWALAFVFTALAAFCGGVYHGLGDNTPFLWKATVMSVGIASFFLLAGTHRRLATVAALKLVVYLTWMTTHDGFIYVIADYGLTLLIAGLVHPAKKWVWGSIGVSVLGALVQQAKLTIHPKWFDYNDLYHVIQILALWLLYRAAASSNEVRRP
ncbi:MAG TPA: hypothetical protein VF883_13180 [Thermoanaerobaculia bacterium]|jgi:hypothetical protein